MAYELEQQQLADRLRRAQLLQQAEAPQGQMVSGHYVNPSITQYLAQGLRQYLGGKEQSAVQEEQKALVGRREQAIAEALRGFSEKAQGTPENAPGDGVGPTMPAQAPDMRGAYAALMQAPDPRMQQAAMQGMIQMPEMEARAADRVADRDFRKQEAEAARAARVEQLQMAHQQRMEAMQAQNASREQMAAEQREFQRQIASMQIDARKEVANIAASNRPERMMTVMDAEGNPITMPQSQAAGMTPYNPQTAASIKKQKESQQARTQLNEAVGQLKGYYDDLASKGGIVSEQQGSIGNLMSRIGASDAGQLVGGAVGAKNQQLRDKIEQTRPLLLNLIKNATGMSAQQMNSNAEMQMYLRAATDPKLSYEANVEALNNLDKLFGLGIGFDTPKDESTPPAMPPGFKVRR